MKYGFIVEPLRDLYGLYIVYYVWCKKVYKTVWQYIINAPIFIWDSLIFAGAVIMATLAEWPIIDNEILEERCILLLLTLYGGIQKITQLSKRPNSPAAKHRTVFR